MDAHIETAHISVRYAETDQMGIVHHGTYPVWFEVARSHFMEERGHPVRNIESRGVFFTVTHLSYRLLAPARLGDTVAIDTWVDRLQSRQITFQYRARVDARTLVTGRTDLVCVDGDLRPRRWPDWLREAAGPARGRDPDLTLD